MASCLAVPLRADVVYNQNTIVQGSVAVGFDAVNGEDFGFDTLRMKENNTRLAFQDTTSVPGLPGDDWQIIANDSASGGANYLAIEHRSGPSIPFRVMAGGSDDALRIADDGSAGLFTGSPASGLHIDITHDAAEPSQGAFVGPADATPAGALLEVQGPIYLSRDGISDLSVDTSGEMRLFVEGGAVFVGNFEIGSSRDFKEDIRGLDPAAARATLGELRPVAYRYKSGTKRHLGFIAEDVPEPVATESGRSLRPMEMIALLSAVVREREGRIAARDRELSDLRESVERLRIQALPPTGDSGAPVLTADAD